MGCINLLIVFPLEFNLCEFSSTNDCDEHANCYQNGSSYECYCHIGYHGDGFTCKGNNHFLVPSNFGEILRELINELFFLVKGTCLEILY